jgi:hypothetical protein
MRSKVEVLQKRIREQRCGLGECTSEGKANEETFKSHMAGNHLIRLRKPNSDGVDCVRLLGLLATIRFWPGSAASVSILSVNTRTAVQRALVRKS